jgi:hypothetical protein
MRRGYTDEHTPIWCLAVEVASEEAADRFVKEFDTSPTQLSEDDSLWIWYSIGKEKERYVIVIPHHTPKPTGPYVSASRGPNSKDHAQLLTDIGDDLYIRLMQCKAPFEMAVAGNVFGDHTELIKSIREGVDNLSGVVLSAKLWEEAGRPATFVPLPEGCSRFLPRPEGVPACSTAYWIPWKGESDLTAPRRAR